MSLFKKTIPVDLKSFKAALPPGGAVTKVVWDKRTPAVIIEYDDPTTHTGYTFPVERDPDAKPAPMRARRKAKNTDSEDGTAD